MQQNYFKKLLWIWVHIIMGSSTLLCLLLSIVSEQQKKTGYQYIIINTSATIMPTLIMMSYTQNARHKMASLMGMFSTVCTLWHMWEDYVLVPWGCLLWWMSYTTGTTVSALKSAARTTIWSTHPMFSGTALNAKHWMYPLLSTVTRSAQATMIPFWNKPPRRLTLTHSKPTAQCQTQRHLVEIKK